MSIQIGGYEFCGPFLSPHSLEERGGVYAILDSRPGGSRYALDIGESAGVRSRVQTHDRVNCWHANALGVIRYAALYTPGQTARGRQAIEHRLRILMNPSCGVR